MRETPADVLTFTVSDRGFAVALLAVVGVSLRVAQTELPGCPPPIVGLVRRRGQFVPVVSLVQRLGFPPREPGMFDHFLFVQTPRRVLALETERVGAVERWNPEELQAPAGITPPVQGVVEDPEGVWLFLDLEALISPALDRSLDELLDRHELRVQSDREVTG